ncbi:hypothetical protein FOA52_012239 [Chlamydomonas sp. UWO 241]|nr:hypothetical protein FOA52_012239 [Chlamydomonas sp. UWO 241]
MTQQLRDMGACLEIVLSRRGLSMPGPTFEALRMAKDVLHKASASDHGPAWLGAVCTLASCYNTLMDWASEDTDALEALADIVLTPALGSLLRDVLATDGTAAPLRKLLSCMDQLALGYTGAVEPDSCRGRSAGSSGARAAAGRCIERRRGEQFVAQFAAGPAAGLSAICTEPGAAATVPVQRSLQEIEAAMFDAAATATVSVQQSEQPAASGADRSSPQLAGPGRTWLLRDFMAQLAASSSSAASRGTAPKAGASSLSAGGAPAFVPAAADSATTPAAGQVVALSLSAGGAPEWVPAAPAPLQVQSQASKTGACSSLQSGAQPFVPVQAQAPAAPAPKAGACSLRSGEPVFVPARAQAPAAPAPKAGACSSLSSGASVFVPMQPQVPAAPALKAAAGSLSAGAQPFVPAQAPAPKAGVCSLRSGAPVFVPAQAS